MNEVEKKEPRKMTVIELGNGQLYKEMQDAFEEAMKLSDKHRMKVSFNVGITIQPPKSVLIGSRTIRTGQVLFEVKPATVKKTSIAYDTEVNDQGFIIAQGTDVMNLIQEDMGDVLMKDVETKLAKFNKGVSNG